MIWVTFLKSYCLTAIRYRLLETTDPDYVTTDFKIQTLESNLPLHHKSYKEWQNICSEDYFNDNRKLSRDARIGKVPTTVHLQVGSSIFTSHQIISKG
jgi:hypothetical protein